MQAHGSTTEVQAAGKSTVRWRARLILLVVFVLLLGGLFGVGLVVVRKLTSVYTDVRSHLGGPYDAPAAARPMAISQACPEVSSASIREIRASQANAMVPLVPNLVLDVIWTVQQFDLETLIKFQSVDDHTVSISSSGPGISRKNGALVVTPSSAYPPRAECQADLLSAHVLVTQNDTTGFPVYNHTTQISVSRDVYDALKAGRGTKLDYRQDYRRVGNGYSWKTEQDGMVHPLAGTIAPFPAIVNGKVVDLPVLRATGFLDVYAVNLVILDDRANPLVLDIDMPIRQWRIKTTKINYPVAKSIESDLAQQGRTAVYGIYFDFDSALIRPESEPVLAEIAEALKQNSDWRLSIDGHTDNVGSDAHNLQLSQIRAEAVKKALTDRYAIAPERLATAGFGASQPKSTNDTIEGRALNRRVELVRQ